MWPFFWMLVVAAALLLALRSLVPEWAAAMIVGSAYVIASLILAAQRTKTRASSGRTSMWK